MFFRREIQKRKTARKRALSVSEKLLYFRLFFQPFILHLSTRFSCVPPRFFAGFRRLSIKRTAAYAEKRQKCGFFSAFFSAEMLFETRFLSRHAAFFTQRLLGKLLSSLVSSSLQNISSAFRRHSFSESVYFASLSFLGLVRSFHDCFSLRSLRSLIEFLSFFLRPKATIPFIIHKTARLVKRLCGCSHR